MRVYLAGLHSVPKDFLRALLFGQVDKIITECVKNGIRVDPICFCNKPLFLESFIYMGPQLNELLPLIDDFLLDSGAFTFMQQKKQTKIDWTDYVTRYADYINKFKIKKYFELDIDHLLGWEAVKKMTAFLWRETGVRPIPVWHMNRGKQGFIEMCQEYDYVSIGSDSQYNKYLKWFIDTAHSYGCKIHGLGYTQIKNLRYLKFDSVDSTSWVFASKIGQGAMRFDGKNIQKISKPANSRVKNNKGLLIQGFIQWYMYQQYMLEQEEDIA